MTDFSKRFPSIDTFQLGYNDFACSLSRDFALAVADAFIRWTALEYVNLYCQGPHVDIARVLTGLNAAPALEHVRLGLFDGDAESTVHLLQDAGLLCSTKKNNQVVPHF